VQTVLSQFCHGRLGNGNYGGRWPHLADNVLGFRSEPPATGVTKTASNTPIGRWWKPCARASGPRQRTLCYLGELNGLAEARFLRTIEVFNAQGEAQQLKLFPADVEPPADDEQVARVLVNRVRLKRTRQFGACWLGWELSKRLELDSFFQQAVDRAGGRRPEIRP